MKVIFIFFPLILSIACSKDFNKEVESAPKPVVAVSPPSEEKYEKVESIPLPEHLTTDFPKPEIEEVDEKLELKTSLKTLAKQSGLKSLASAKFQNNDLEIRILQHSGWWDAQFFVLKRSNEKWSADFREIQYFEETGKVKKQTKLKIGEPKSGWENLWNKLSAEKILTLQSGFENGGSDPCPDCGFSIIETKTPTEYRFYQYTTPSLNSELFEKQQVAKISNIIAEEFDLQNFKSQ